MIRYRMVGEQPEIMKIILVAVLMGTALWGQSREELETRYGKPVSETFVVRPGIEATTTYSITGAITEVLISPRIPDVSLSKTLGVKAIDNVVMKQIVDELVPMSKRGKFLMGGFLNLFCPPQDDCMGTAKEDYERLSIYYHASIGGGPNYFPAQN
jgi:hypothetical protein